MGNAALSVRHPASLEHEVQYLEHGKVVESSGGLLRLEKSGGAVVGCGGRVVFRNAESDSQWTYRVLQQISAHAPIGHEVTVLAADQHISAHAPIGHEITVLAPDQPHADAPIGHEITVLAPNQPHADQQISAHAPNGHEITVLAPDQPHADQQVAAELGMPWREVRESVALVKSTIGDSSACSELYCYVDYNVTNSGRYEWTRNDLYLKATHTWAEGSEMVIDVSFLTHEEKEVEKERQKEMAKTMRNVIFMFGNNTTDVTSKT
ncbi:uncharacterized protein LOC134080331 [Sardina pilchardus]|uniref:uncharacterized protein LOC134080331 n=1 Tax=Sardina pilchardus TaxID=27697 RepID=UPI002E129175